MDDPLAGAIESKDPDTEPTSPANPKPHYYNGGASTATFEIGDVAAVKDSAHDDHYWISKVVRVTHDSVTFHAYSTSHPSIDKAKFRPLYSHRDRFMYRPPPGVAKRDCQWTTTVSATQLPLLVLAHKLELLASGQLSAPSRAILASDAMGTATHATDSTNGTEAASQ